MEGKILNNLSGDAYNSGALNKDNLDEKILAAAAETVRLLAEKNKTITTAESCTGGMLGASLTEISGVSAYYKEGVITYSNEAKMKFLGVKRETLEKYGAVSSKTAVEMASGAMESAKSDISVAITGIAGPLGDTREKCVGLVYICVKIGDNHRVEKHIFDGERHVVRQKSTLCALNTVIKMIK
ncbi:CinA family protein [Qingrenia yutianensis]|uniref:CinA family protein n=1 Tax=Qingrenia yutianensis TaxID=2763676 RepID=A0A926ITF9_9FIRM|nr:CinA family protein [Qingrenia yutianensis]MBC8597359.1 CinA family protein [Qingrenia yutianensis]